MKKRYLTLIILAISVILTFSGCGAETPNGDTEGTTNENQKPPLEDVVDYSIFNDPYNTILSFMVNPQDYQGQNIKIDAISSVVYNFGQNKVMSHIMLGLDPTGCCNASYEIRSKSGKYPEIGTSATFTGTFMSGGYIELYSWKGVEATEPNYDVDTLNMTTDQLNQLISEYSANYSASEYAGKTVHIFGHHIVQSGYKYLMGLTGEGVGTWYIELYDPTGSLSFPTVSGNLVNPVEIIGTFSVYYENGISYPCITVKQVNKVECVFS